MRIVKDDAWNPSETRIIASVSGLQGEGETVLDAIRLLSRDKAAFPDKADYISHVAETASQPVLAVKVANRLCNTRDFMKLKGAGLEKARAYFAAGEPLFEHIGKTQSPDRLLDKAIKDQIRAEIKAVGEELKRE